MMIKSVELRPGSHRPDKWREAGNPRHSVIILLFATVQFAIPALGAPPAPPNFPVKNAKAMTILRAADRAVREPPGWTFDFESFGTGNRQAKTPQRTGHGVFIPQSGTGGFNARYDFDKTLSGKTTHMVVAFDGETGYLLDDKKKQLLFSLRHRLGYLLVMINTNRYFSRLNDREPFSQLGMEAIPIWAGTKASLPRVCRVLDLSRSSLYLRAAEEKAKAEPDAALVERIHQLILQHPTYGYRCAWALPKYREWIKWYNKERPHQALGYQSPVGPGGRL